jgi:hypothetical protein
MSDLNTATVRTGAPFVYTAILTALANKLLGIELSAEGALIAVSAFGTLYYRIARVLERRWPDAGTILLGSNAQPTYSTTQRG